MQLEVKKYQFDVRQACAHAAEFANGKSFADYTRDAMLKAAVERQFEIIGEALNRLAKLDAGVIEQITDYRRVIAFRNILVHAYAQIDDRVVWGVVETKLPTLTAEVGALLEDEAHRVRRTSDTRFTPKAERDRKSQTRELLDAAKVTVFLLDENQFVRPDEVGQTNLSDWRRNRRSWTAC